MQRRWRCKFAAEPPTLLRTYRYLTVSCGVSSRGIVGPYLFEATVTGAEYLNMLQVSIVSAIHQLYGDEEIYYQQDRPPLHYHHDVRAYLDDSFRDRWVGRRGRGSAQNPPTFA
jgi:hypothetical protein